MSSVSPAPGYWLTGGRAGCAELQLAGPLLAAARGGTGAAGARDGEGWEMYRYIYMSAGRGRGGRAGILSVTSVQWSGRGRSDDRSVRALRRRQSPRRPEPGHRVVSEPAISRASRPLTGPVQLVTRLRPPPSAARRLPAAQLLCPPPCDSSARPDRPADASTDIEL